MRTLFLFQIPYIMNLLEKLVELQEIYGLFDSNQRELNKHVFAIRGGIQ